MIGAFRCAVVALCLSASGLFAQNVTAPLDEGIKPEVRLDVIDRQGSTAVELGGGIQVPAGYYARIGVIGAVGTAFPDRGNSRTARVDVVGRFLLDPFRQSRWGLSAGAGLSVRAQGGSVVRPYLLAVADLEGPRTASGISPAFQVGIGGGLRIGGALRWGAVRAR